MPAKAIRLRQRGASRVSPARFPAGEGAERFGQVELRPGKILRRAAQLSKRCEGNRNAEGEDEHLHEHAPEPHGEATIG
jgi:hypothetical protein